LLLLKQLPLFTTIKMHWFI